MEATRKRVVFVGQTYGSGVGVEAYLVIRLWTW